MRRSLKSTRYVSSIDRKSFIVESESDVISSYNDGSTMKRISELSHGLYSEWEVYNILDTNEIERRNHNRKGVLNEHYFSNIDTSIKAYILGFIQADGSIRNDLSGFSISQNQNFSWFIENLIKKEFYTEVHRSIDKNSHSLNITSAILSKDLSDKGIIPNKSKEQTEQHIDILWKSVPEEFIGDFVRGGSRRRRMG